MSAVDSRQSSVVDSRQRGLVGRVIVDAPGGPVTLFESADVNRDLDDAIARGAPAPYGRVLWPSALPVARALVPLLSPGVRLLELGAGTGLVSLVAARAGARVLATDVDDGCLAAVAAGAAALGVTVETALFDVRSAAPLPPADVVVAADLLYEEALAAATARRALEALEGGAVVVVGDPGRVFRARFVALLAERGREARFVDDTGPRPPEGRARDFGGPVGVAVVRPAPGG